MRNQQTVQNLDYIRKDHSIQSVECSFSSKKKKNLFTFSSSKKKMEFLAGTKKILRYLDAYRRGPLDLGFTKITSRFIEFFAFISMLVTTIPIAVFCYLNRNSFKIASAGVLYLIANSSIKIIYLALLVKRKSVIESIDHLQKLIQTSKI